MKREIHRPKPDIEQEARALLGLKIDSEQG
jgi:hypothetical protein